MFAAFTAISVAQAEGSKDTKDKTIPPGLLKKYDTNQDGVLDEKEKAALEADKAKMMEKRLEKFDANKDGKIDASEEAAEKAAKEKAKAEMKAKNEAKRLEKWDANKDGKIDASEEAAEKAAKEKKKKTE